MRTFYRISIYLILLTLINYDSISRTELKTSEINSNYNSLILLKDFHEIKKEEAFSKAKEVIKKYEGYRNSSYTCPKGQLTIGWGHKISKRCKISKSKAEEYLTQDLEYIYNRISKRHNKFKDLNTNQMAGLLSFYFNIGETSFNKSSISKILKDKKTGNIEDELLKWVNITKIKDGKKIKTKLKGLEKRRVAERELFIKDPLEGITYVESFQQKTNLNSIYL